MAIRARAILAFFIGENMTIPVGIINGSRNLGDWEYGKFRADSNDRPAVAVINGDGTNIANGLATSVNQTNAINTTSEEAILLRRIVKLLESNAVVDIQNRQKVTIDGITNGLGALLGVSIPGLTSGAGIPSTNYPTNAAPVQQPGTSSWQPVWIGPVDQRFQIMDNARLNYANSIRNNITFS
jgi:hypothetical protein